MASALFGNESDTASCHTLPWSSVGPHPTPSSSTSVSEEPPRCRLSREAVEPCERKPLINAAQPLTAGRKFVPIRHTLPYSSVRSRPMPSSSTPLPEEPSRRRLPSEAFKLGERKPAINTAQPLIVGRKLDSIEGLRSTLAKSVVGYSDDIIEFEMAPEVQKSFAKIEVGEIEEELRSRTGRVYRIELLPGKLKLRECTSWAHTISRSSEPGIKKSINDQLYNMGILARRTETESTIFSLTGEGGIIKSNKGKITRKVPDSVLSSVFVPGYNGIVFEVAVSQNKSDLLTDISEWLDPNSFEVNVVIIILFEGYGLKDKDGKVLDIEQMPVTWHVFRRGTSGLPERQDSGVIIPASGRVKFPGEINFSVKELCGSTESVVDAITQALTEENSETADLGREARLKAYEHLTSIDAMVESLDRPSMLRIDPVLLLFGATDAIRKHREEHVKFTSGAKRVREEDDERTDIKRTRFEKQLNFLRKVPSRSPRSLDVDFELPPTWRPENYWE